MNLHDDSLIYVRSMTRTPRSHRARVSVEMRCGGQPLLGEFTVDSGASFSFAPLEWAALLMDIPLEDLALQELEVRDVHGKKPTGIQFTVELTLLEDEREGRSEPLVFEETIHFCQGWSGKGLLGQSAFFEKFGVVFLNFPQNSEGRRFALFEPPQS